MDSVFFSLDALRLHFHIYIPATFVFRGIRGVPVNHLQRCSLRPSVLGQDRYETKKIGLGLGLAVLVLFCETRSCNIRRHNDLEGHSNFSSTIYSFSILCLEHHYCGVRQRRLLT